MVVLSARFTLLASLCALVAVAIPPRAEAAHIYAGHSMEKHVSSPRPHRRTPGAAFLGRQGTTHSHDEENDGQYPDSSEQRSLGLPPLLRRHTVSDHAQEGYDHHDQGHHDHASNKVSRSAFARSRYRQGPAAQYRRSSVFVPGEQGNMYLVSGSLPKDAGEGPSDTGKLRRQVDESDLALGRIDIMSASQSPPGTQRLASLTVNSTPIDWTSGQTTAKAFPLNASTTNQTQFIMMPLESDGAGGFSKHVTLATEVFDASNAVMVMYCATYDSDPGATSALLMTPCTTQSVQVNDADDPCSGRNDASSPSLHESQTFSYDPSTGKIEPISIIATSSDAGGDGDDDDNLGPCITARSVRRRDNTSSTTSSSAKPSISLTSAAPSASALQQARNVTLVYVAGALEVPASASSSASSNFVSASASQAPVPAPASAAVVTTTLTTTVLGTATASGSGSGSQPSSSSRAISPAQADVSVSLSSQPPSSSATTIVPKPSASGTPAHSNPVNPTSTVPKPPAASSKVQANTDESFEVDIVGIGPSTTSGASLSTSATTSHSSTSMSLDPLAVATSVAKQAATRRDVIMSASVAR